MPVLKNPKHEIFSQRMAAGCDKQESSLAAGYSKKSAPQAASYLSKKPEIIARIAEINAKIVEKSEWDAARVLQRLGEIVDARAIDFAKPRSEWTDAMERVACDVVELKERSTDGVQAGESKAWDKVGDGFRIPLSVKVKALELIGRTKAVDAFVQQKQGDVNVLVVTAEKAREIAGARQRLQRVIEIPKHAD